MLISNKYTLMEFVTFIYFWNWNKNCISSN